MIERERKHIMELPSANRVNNPSISASLDNFMTYVRTLQLMAYDRRNIDENSPVHIPQREIESRFFPNYKMLSHKEATKQLVKDGRLKIMEQRTKEGRLYFTYSSLEKGKTDISMIPQGSGVITNPIIKRMKDYLMDVSLIDGSPSTEYFDFFTQFKNIRPELFFKVDAFAKRIHTPISNFHKEYRKNILLHGRGTSSIDVVTMQPLLLGKILKMEIGPNEFSKWISSGVDIYKMLQEIAKLETRDEAKKRFFEILFSQPSKELDEMFGGASWIRWVNHYKQQLLTRNPHSRKKPHSNLAWLLQTTEVKIMYKVWCELYSHSIPFLTVHDEIIIEDRNRDQAIELFENVMRKEFDFFKLN